MDPFRSLTPHTTSSMLWLPPSTSMSSRAQYSPYTPNDSSRPVTAIHAAGYSSRVRILFTHSLHNRAMFDTNNKFCNLSPSYLFKNLVVPKVALQNKNMVAIQQKSQ